MKELINREMKGFGNLMKINEVKQLELINQIKMKTQLSDQQRLHALGDLKKLKAKLHKKLLKEDMRQNYIYDVLFERWKDRERKLED